MKTKYEIEFSKEVVEKNKMRLINQLWKLIPMRENNEDWKKQLDTVLIEIVGLNELFNLDPHFLQLIIKLEGLRVQENLDFSVYRKVVFNCINLLQGMKEDE